MAAASTIIVRTLSSWLRALNLQIYIISLRNGQSCLVPDTLLGPFVESATN